MPTTLTPIQMPCMIADDRLNASVRLNRTSAAPIAFEAGVVVTLAAQESQLQGQVGEDRDACSQQADERGDGKSDHGFPFGRDCDRGIGSAGARSVSGIHPA
ncbi:MAG: hypothetical protein U5K33_09725 [Halofilum sp. (in: g-proteobacteria)]|nr:hypothetical protein [Halofilum sp. (in: g-proteobacteria)]